MSPDLPCSREEEIRKTDVVMHSAYRSLLGQDYDMGLLQLVSSRFNNVMCSKKVVS